MIINKKITTTYVALGSNLDNPQQHVQRAIIELAQLPYTSLITHSSIYLTKPLGPQDQPDYINAVAILETLLTPADLLETLLAIEIQHGRIRKERWGARILDLDIILYGNEILNTAELTLPHPGLPVRNFWLYPLLEIAPDLILPNGSTLEMLVQQSSQTELSPRNLEIKNS